MKALIDTQVFVWLLTEDPKLGKSTRDLLGDDSNRVLISYFSFFEMVIKSSIGKMKIDLSVIDDLPRMGIELIMPDVDALRTYGIYNPSNKDPFDNILLSVARNEKCTFVTSDDKILATPSKGLKMLDAHG